jgi:GrpB-like predicted nucleotidyltransferase (UPF0157 family)
VVDHDPTWAAEAAAEIDRLRVALGPVAVRVEHIGSTAVPGLAAKPIIDLQVSVTALEPRDRYVRPLERAGYLFAPSPDAPTDGSSRGPPARPRSHHVHVCAAGGAAEHRHLAVRDFLRANPDEAGTLRRAEAVGRGAAIPETAWRTSPGRSRHGGPPRPGAAVGPRGLRRAPAALACRGAAAE